MNDDAIAKTLGITTVVEIPCPVVTTSIASDSSNQVQDDFDFARNNLKEIIEKGQDALAGIVEVATMSQMPRGYEVVATLIKAMSDANKDLLELQKRRIDLTGEAPKTQPTTVNNNLFVGSTTELQRLIKAQNEQSK